MTSFVSSAATIIDSTVSDGARIRKFKRNDIPRGLAESEALACLKSEIHDWRIASCEDYFLLRFLRARKLSIPKAKEMLSKYLEYRVTNKYLAEVCEKSYVPAEFIIKQIPFIHTGTDFDGRPVFVVQGGHADLRGIFERGGQEDFLKVGHYILELLVYTSEKQRKQHGCTEIVSIGDLAGFSFRNAFHTQTLQTCMYAARTLESFYPELLHHAIVINANWVFNSLYNAMKPFLSDDTIEKVQIYGYDAKKWKPVLRKYIPENSIPVEYGGNWSSLESENLNAFDGFHPSI